MNKIFQGKAIRTLLHNDPNLDKPEEVEVGFLIKEGYDHLPWVWIKGGPTGYESAPYAHLLEGANEGLGWSACFGTINSWPRLDVPNATLMDILPKLIDDWVVA